MIRSLTLHNEVLHTQMKRLGAYEVKTEGDAFMISFSDPIQAANFCLRTQLGNPSILPLPFSSPSPLYHFSSRSPSISGEPLLREGSVTGRMCFAQGGQILLSTKTYTAITTYMGKSMCSAWTGLACVLRGEVKESMNLYQVRSQRRR